VRPIQLIPPEDLDLALKLASIGELRKGMGVLLLSTMRYHAIEHVVRYAYPRLSPRQQRHISNCLKDYDPDREAILMSGGGDVKIFSLKPHHIAARNHAKETHDQTNKDRI
jgi:hypothetical protein